MLIAFSEGRNGSIVTQVRLETASVVRAALGEIETWLAVANLQQLKTVPDVTPMTKNFKNSCRVDLACRRSISQKPPIKTAAKIAPRE